MPCWLPATSLYLPTSGVTSFLCILLESGWSLPLLCCGLPASPLSAACRDRQCGCVKRGGCDTGRSWCSATLFVPVPSSFSLLLLIFSLGPSLVLFFLSSYSPLLMRHSIYLLPLSCHVCSLACPAIFALYLSLFR